MQEKVRQNWQPKQKEELVYIGQTGRGLGNIQKNRHLSAYLVIGLQGYHPRELRQLVPFLQKMRHLHL